MLDCNKIQAGLSEYIDSALPEELAEATRAHLRSCAVCTKIAEELTQTSRLLAFLPRPEPSESFERKLTLRLAGQALRPKPITLGEKLSAWWIRPRVRPAVASALAVAALIPLVVVRVRPASPVALPTHMQTVTENREVEQALQEHLTAKTSEAFGDSSGLLLASAHNELEPGS
ncbi:anti-sigma factor family protein [Armatimonas sp.]|uniref:anti-sigma factor family protein n=1 Tax=Armatimonas sp. TaxID=1872638 RepID=UPI00374C8A23